MTRIQATLFAGLGAAMLGLTAYGSTMLWVWDHPALFRLSLVQGAVFAGAAWIVFAATRGGAEPRWLLPAVLLLALLMRLILVPAPTVSTDIFRYVWDGRVQAAGINPYRYLPVDAALAPLRDKGIYPFINRASYAPTIYPPVAQMVFLLASRVAETLWAMKAAMVAFEMVTIWAVIRLLAHRGLSRARVILYAWHPLPLWEFAGSGHVDAVSITFLTLAFVAADRRSPVWSGVALACATLVKFFPVALGPALWRPWGWRFPAAFLGAAVLLYLPYLGVGTRVFGFLGQYTSEEGIKDGRSVYLMLLLDRFTTVPTVIRTLYAPLALLILAGLAAAVAFRPRRADPDIGGAILLMTALTVIVSPHFAWYFAWLIPLLCVRARVSVLYLTLAAPMLYLPGFLTDGFRQSLIYAPFVLILLAEHFIRRPLKETRHGNAAGIPAS